MNKFRNMVTVKASESCMLESEGISRKQVESSKPTNNIADGVFRNAESNDKAMQRKTFVYLQNVDLVSSNACNTFFSNVHL